MGQFTHFIGIDVSAQWLDLALSDAHDQRLAHQRIANTPEALRKLWRAWQQTYSLTLASTLACAENTGLYTRPLLRWAAEEPELILWVEAPHKVKFNSAGAYRGTSDKLAAERIANYARSFQNRHQPWKPEAKALETLQFLLNRRKWLVTTRAALNTADQEIRKFAPDFAVACPDTHKGLNADIDRIDKQIDGLIAQDERLKHQTQRLLTIPGVGRVTCLYLLVHTRAFTRLKDPKQLACHAGVVPFEQQSGSSVRTQSRVSHQANKDLKRQLHIAATVAARHDNDLKNYFLRKLKEGKNKMSVLNAIRNKLVHRICAVIRNDKPYNKTKFAAAA